MGDGQFIESSTDWASQGKRSLKITRKGNIYVWTDIFIPTVFEGDAFCGEVTMKNECNVSIFLYFLMKQVIFIFK